jgi:hypothetical protein
LVRRVAAERAVELREAAGHDAVDEALGLDRAGAALLEGALGEVAADSALIAYHQQDVVLSGDLCETLADLVALA